MDFSELAETLEKDIPHIAVVALLSGDKVLLGRRVDSGKWTLPGGHVDKGETPYEGALRELEEEAGIAVRSLNLIGHEVISGNTGRTISIHAYTAEVPLTNPSIKNDPDREMSEWRWVSFDGEELKNLHNARDFALEKLGLVTYE